MKLSVKMALAALLLGTTFAMTSVTAHAASTGCQKAESEGGAGGGTQQAQKAESEGGAGGGTQQASAQKAESEGGAGGGTQQAQKAASEGGAGALASATPCR